MLALVDGSIPLSGCECTAASSLCRTPQPNLGQDRQLQSEGYQKSNALEVSFRGRPVRFFSGQAQYTLAKTYNNTSGITYFPASSNAPEADWARSDNDRRNKFDLLGTLNGGKWFDFGTALSLYSGKAVNVTTGSDENRDSLPLDRPTGLHAQLAPWSRGTLVSISTSLIHSCSPGRE